MERGILTWVSAHGSDRNTVPSAVMLANEYRRWVYRSTGILVTLKSWYNTLAPRCQLGPKRLYEM